MKKQLFKVNLTSSGSFIVNFENISHLFLIIPFFPLNLYMLNSNN